MLLLAQTDAFLCMLDNEYVFVKDKSVYVTFREHIAPQDSQLAKLPQMETITMNDYQTKRSHMDV